MANFDPKLTVEKTFKGFTNNQKTILTRYFEAGGDLGSLKRRFQLSEKMEDEEFVSYLKNFIRMHGVEKLEAKLTSASAPKQQNRDSTGSVQRISILPKLSIGDDGTQLVRVQRKPGGQSISEETTEVIKPPTSIHDEVTERLEPEKHQRRTDFAEVVEPINPPVPNPPKSPSGKPAPTVPPVATPENTTNLSPEELKKRELVLQYKAKGFLGPPNADWDGKTERRKSPERRTGVDRRDSVETIFKNKRFGKERRSGKDRRQKY